MTNVTLESPLVNIHRLGKRELQISGRSCWLDETAFLDMLNLRGDAQDPVFAAAVQAACGLALPVQANTVSAGNGRQLLWLGPDEWLLKVAANDGDTIEAALRSALAGKHFSVVPVGSANTTLTVQGPGAALLLACGCPLDLHARAFPDGAFAQTHVAKANVALYCQQAGQHYELTVRRSFAEYLFNWLCAAGS